MSSTTTVTSKGQVTIPKKVRDALGIAPHDLVEIVLDGTQAVLRPIPGRLRDIAGILPDLGLDPDEMIRLAKEERAESLFEQQRRA
jgi:AbrB family looped-hinge helix DNA binding protein